MEFKWKRLPDRGDTSTYRVKVIDGWLVLVLVRGGATTMQFVKDTDHTWIIDKEN